MKRKSIVALTFVFSLAAGAFLLPTIGPEAQAQQNCPEIRGVIQGILPTSYPLAPLTDVWGGTIHVTIGGEFLIGGLSGNDGGETQHGARGGRYQAYLCNPTLSDVLLYPPKCNDSITWEVANAVFGFVPGKVGLGAYKGNSAKLVSGTGRFLGASGNLNVAGPYILWADPKSPWGIYGRWNGELSGNICGVQ